MRAQVGRHLNEVEMAQEQAAKNSMYVSRRHHEGGKQSRTGRPQKQLKEALQNKYNHKIETYNAFNALSVAGAAAQARPCRPVVPELTTAASHDQIPHDLWAHPARNLSARSVDKSPMLVLGVTTGASDENLHSRG
jgi:hypothetical protein